MNVPLVCNREARSDEEHPVSLLDSRIGLDYRSALRPNSTGVGRYVRDLVAGLVGVDGPRRYTLFHDEGRHAAVPVGTRLCHMTSLPTFQRNGLRQVWEEVWLPAAIVRSGLDVYHSPNGFLPYVLPSRLGTVVTVHDVIHRALPGSVGRFFRTRLDAGLRHCAKRADVIIADSQSTAHDISTFYGVPSGAITVIYPGVSNSFRPPKADEAHHFLENRFGLRRPFILYVGGLGARKNVLTLLEAFAALRQLDACDVDLVLVGATSSATNLTEHVSRNGLQEVVHFPGYVADEELPFLYGAAAVFAYPSLYEGFGYPVVEAMACGAPVVCSNTSSLPEVSGWAGLLVPPRDVGGWVEALRSVLLAPDGATALRRASETQAARFTLRKEAAATLEIYALAAKRAAVRARCRSARTGGRLR